LQYMCPVTLYRNSDALDNSIVTYDILPFQCSDKLNFKAVNLMPLYLQISSIFFSCWNYLIQKTQGNGISWKQRYIEFTVNSWDSVHISENRLTIYFIGKTILMSFFNTRLLVATLSALIL